MSSDPTSLDRLHGIIAPPSAPWWPPAPGWKWVLAFAAAGLIVALVRLFHLWQRNRYRREALTQLRQQERALNDPTLRATALAKIAELIKRTALSAWPRKEIASLTGARWLAFLDRTGRGRSFPNSSADLLEQISYDPRALNAMSESQQQKIVAHVRHWIRRHDTR